MSYRENYLQIVQPSNLPIIQSLFEDRNDFEEYGISSYEIRQNNDNLPYLLVTVDFEKLGEKEEMLCAQLLLLYLDDAKQYFSFLTGVFLYLPVICVAQEYPENMTGKFSLEAAMGHELLHLEDIVNLYDKDPLHQKQRKKLSFAVCKTKEEIMASFDLQISELFLLEPRAYALDFQIGERYICDILPNNKELKMTFKDADKFIRFHIFRNIQVEIMSYEAKLKELNIAEELPIEETLNRYGDGIWKHPAYDGFLLTKKEYSKKVFYAFFE